MKNKLFVQVAVEAPLHRHLTYSVSENFLEEKTSDLKGLRVNIPLGKRDSYGVVVNTNPELPSQDIQNKIKNIISLTEDPRLGEKTLEWLQWLSDYYIHPLGLVCAMAFAPSAADRKRKKKVPQSNFLANIQNTSSPLLNSDQEAAVNAITSTPGFGTFLLFGVTGSGKTEVYLNCIEKVLQSGKQVLVLVPEISLTPQLIERFVGRFGNDVAVIHSHLTEREKSDDWKEALSGKKRILVGARSALFCPIENIGLIVVDEEHEPSYKQEEQLKYNARDSAVMKARILNCPIILGSATPSLESWQNVLSGKYKILKLSSRVENRPMPHVEVVDLRKSKGEKRDHFIPQWLSTPLYKELKETLDRKEQAALFINRRGFAQFGLCSGCGFTEQCPSCSVTLTLHKKGLSLICHYCGFKKNSPQICPSCREFTLKPIGLGTEKVKEEVEALFPGIRVARADRDEITSRKELEALLEKIHKQEVDIIVGTQMIAKGHDFPNLTLVGTLAADMGLHFPDFRSSERTFQLLTQVAGRAGRHGLKGKVFVQTYVPEHPAIKYSLNHDFLGFAEEELKERRDLHYPPFGKLALLRIQGPDSIKTEDAASFILEKISLLAKKLDLEHTLEFLGPTEAALAKLKNKYRFQILLKSPSATNLNRFLKTLNQHSEDWISKPITLSVDVDPLHLL